MLPAGSLSPSSLRNGKDRRRACREDGLETAGASGKGRRCDKEAESESPPFCRRLRHIVCHLFDINSESVPQVTQNVQRQAACMFDRGARDSKRFREGQEL